MNITAEDIHKAIHDWPCKYRDEKTGEVFTGAPVSLIASQLRDIGWKNVPRIDEHDLRQMGVVCVKARYASGVRRGRVCMVAKALSN